MDAAALEPVRLDATAPGHRKVNPLAAGLLPEQVCRHFSLLPIAYRDGVVTIATSRPCDEAEREAAAALRGREVRFVLAPEAELASAIDAAFWRPDTIAAPQPPRRVTTPEAPTRLGDLLVARGLATDADVELALREQARTGSRLGEVLVDSETISPNALVAILAEHFQLPLADVAAEPDPAALATIPEPLQRRLRVVPIAADDDTLSLATADALDDETLAQLREQTPLRPRGELASPAAIEALLQRAHGERYIAAATSELRRRFPRDSASRPLSLLQLLLAALLAAAIAAGLATWWTPTANVVVGAIAAFTLLSALHSLTRRASELRRRDAITVGADALAALDERLLPSYSVLVAVGAESCAVDAMLASIEAIDYPTTKLDVRLLCDERDSTSIEALAAHALPAHVRSVVVPSAGPRTRAKLFNYGLLQAEGRYVLALDACDRPEPQQLKKAAIVFATAGVSCVEVPRRPDATQAHLAPTLPGHCAHVARDRLVELAAWDPYNLAEDADLGVRLRRAGDRTALLDSRTLVLPRRGPRAWVRRVARQAEGALQTWLVHMRHPLRLLGGLGPGGFIGFQLGLGRALVLLVNPFFWALAVLLLVSSDPAVSAHVPDFAIYATAVQLFVGNLVFAYLSAAEDGPHRVLRVLVAPLSWVLMSVLAWGGLLRLIVRPLRAR